MRKACKICRVMADVDENGRCPSCADVYMASQLNMTYGKYIAQRAAKAAMEAQHGDNEQRCQSCSGWFIPKRPNQIYCCEQCRNSRRRLR